MSKSLEEIIQQLVKPLKDQPQFHYNFFDIFDEYYKDYENCGGYIP